MYVTSTRQPCTGHYQTTYVTSTRQPCTGHYQTTYVTSTRQPCTGHYQDKYVTSTRQPCTGYYQDKYVTSTRQPCTGHYQPTYVMLLSKRPPLHTYAHLPLHCGAELSQDSLTYIPAPCPHFKAHTSSTKVVAGRYVLYGVHAAPVTHLYNLHADAFTATAKTRNKPIVSVISPEVMKPDSTSAHQRISKSIAGLNSSFSMHNTLASQHSGHL